MIGANVGSGIVTNIKDKLSLIISQALKILGNSTENWCYFPSNKGTVLILHTNICKFLIVEVTCFGTMDITTFQDLLNDIKLV